MSIFKSKLLSAVLSVMVLYLTSCGTILHPERKGQKSGKIDTKIAIFDAIGLLFFIIPGVIAFAVDFSNGTIYLPSGGGNSSSIKPIYDLDKMFVIKTNNKHLTEDDIELTVKKHTGKSIDLSSPDIIVKRFDDTINNTEFSVAMGSGDKH